jgi:hypothetical protein
MVNSPNNETDLYAAAERSMTQVLGHVLGELRLFVRGVIQQLRDDGGFLDSSHPE